MKVLFVIHDNKRGGASLSFLEMVTEIRKKHEVFVIVPHKKGFLAEQLKQNNIKYMNAHYFWWMVEKPAGRFLTWLKKTVYFWAVKVNYIEAVRIGIKLRKEKFQIVHSNSSVINFGGLLAKRLGVPHIWHIRELAQDFNFMPVINEKKLYRFMRNRADLFVAISNAVADRMRDLMGFEGIKVVYNGVNERDCIEKTEFPQAGEVINFLIAGNICREKGQKDAVMACQWLTEHSIQSFHLFIAGGGPTGELEEYVKANQLEAYVTILGRLDDMKEIREKTDVEIVGTKCEAFGRVTIEAMRSSNPVIGTASGGTKELVTDGKNGFLYSYGDWEALAERMKCLIQQPELIAKMGKQAYQDVYGKFTPKENADKILEIYDTIGNRK